MRIFRMFEGIFSLKGLYLVDLQPSFIRKTILKLPAVCFPASHLTLLKRSTLKGKNFVATGSKCFALRVNIF